MFGKENRPYTSWMLGIKFPSGSMIHCTKEPCIYSPVSFLPEQIVDHLSHHSLLTNLFSSHPFEMPPSS